MDTCSSRQQLKSDSEQISKEIIIAYIVKYSLYFRVKIVISFTKETGY